MNQPDWHVKVELFLLRLAQIISLALILSFVLWTEYRHLFQ